MGEIVHINEQEIRNWFNKNVFNYDLRDDLTKACEDCAHALDHDEWLDDPDHPVWEIGLSVFNQLEEWRAKKK